MLATSRFSLLARDARDMRFKDRATCINMCSPLACIAFVGCLVRPSLKTSSQSSASVDQFSKAIRPRLTKASSLREHFAC